MTARDKLCSAIETVGSYLCIGIDLHTRYLSRLTTEEIVGWLEPVIDIGAKNCIAYKINLAFIEALGPHGWSVLEQVVRIIPDDRLLILDGKRGDIGSTAEAYAASAFDIYHADAVTVNPYMGYDVLEPFVAYRKKLTFVLALTSNDGARDVQFLDCDGRPLYMRVVESLQAMPYSSQIGFVVGATHPEQLAEVRRVVGLTCPLLIPGIGLQGGSSDAVIAANEGGLAVINVSRGIFDPYAADGINGLRQAVIQFNKHLATA